MRASRTASAWPRFARRGEIAVADRSQRDEREVEVAGARRIRLLDEEGIGAEGADCSEDECPEHSEQHIDAECPEHGTNVDHAPLKDRPRDRDRRERNEKCVECRDDAVWPGSADGNRGCRHDERHDRHECCESHKASRDVRGGQRGDQGRALQEHKDRPRPPARRSRHHEHECGKQQQENDAVAVLSAQKQGGTARGSCLPGRGDSVVFPWSPSARAEAALNWRPS